MLFLVLKWMGRKERKEWGIENGIKGKILRLDQDVWSNFLGSLEGIAGEDEEEKGEDEQG